MDFSNKAQFGELPRGTILEGRYRIEGKLGRGGMATVYRGTHLPLGKTVAIKIPLLDETARFGREARALGRIEHTNVCRVFDVGEHHGRPFLVMELLSGMTVAERLLSGPIPVRESMEIARCVLEALSTIHAIGLLHRDIKPANVMLVGEPERSVKLLDFGLAKTRDVRDDSCTDVTKPGVVMGTPHYMSPESMRGRPQDVSSDVYSVGALLFHMVSGEAPFEGSGNELHVRVARGERKMIHDVAPHVALEVRELIERAMMTDPAQRFSSAKAFVAAVVMSDAYAEPDTDIRSFDPPLRSGGAGPFDETRENPI